jgi:LPS-assembly protein
MIFFADSSARPRVPPDPLDSMVRNRLLVVLIALAGLVVAAPAAHAQTPELGGCTQKWDVRSEQAQQINNTHTLLIKNVAIDCNDIQLFADEAELFADIDRVRASGNVVFVSATNRIAAERMEFNTKTKTGTFHVASGIANLENRGIDRSLFGSQEPDAYFYGETIEKLGPKTYRITRGGFTTCVQPTPRWEMVATSVTLTLEKRAVLTNMVLKVKDVPVFYLPAMYYPINKEDRSTGFLLPIYGTSTIKGQTLNNAFFWAINRSHDATLYHSYYSKTGQGFGGDYRYIQGPGSSGNVQTSILREHEAEYEQSNGTTSLVPGLNSYQVTGSVLQSLPANLRLSGNANYFSSLVSQQRHQQNTFAATNVQRTFGANLSGNWGANGISATVERSEIFTTDTDSNVTGSFPRIRYSRAEKPIGSLPVYFGASGEFVTLVRNVKTATLTTDTGLTRIDLFPTIRFPFTKLPYLTFNSSLGFRATRWSESLDDARVRVPESITRRYFTMASTITGPVLTRIWNTPRRTYAQKFKHVIEPFVTLSRTTPIENRANIIQLESADYALGSVTSASYGLNNRLYAKKESAREILTVAISQTYYTDENAAAVDQQFQSSDFSGRAKPTHFSPVAMQVHVTPTTMTDATFRTEYDTQVNAIRTVAANGGASGGWVRASAGWSLNRYIPDLPGFDVRESATHYLTTATVVRKPGNAFSASYDFNFDMRRKDFLNQRFIAHYNSQCCGIAVEYQKFNFGTRAAVVGVPKDHRFNLSFTLAGIGTFSDLFGAFGGQQGR